VPSLVLALTVLRGNEILVGVRRPETNRFHPNTVSTITGKIPWGLSVGLFSKNCRRYFVRNLFATKLGLADALEYRKINFTVEHWTIIRGTAYDPSGVGLQVVMINFVVDLTGHNDPPLSTPSYSSLVFVPVDKFLEAVATKNPLILFDSKPWELCIHGLCIVSSSKLLNKRL
jgi:hypothetical protein